MTTYAMDWPGVTILQTAASALMPPAEAPRPTTMDGFRDSRDIDAAPWALTCLDMDIQLQAQTPDRRDRRRADAVPSIHAEPTPCRHRHIGGRHRSAAGA